MKRIYAILFMTLLFLIQPKNILAEDLSAEYIQADIKALGSKEVCSLLYKDENKWYELLRHIASGDKEWLKIAVLLYDGSDAGVIEMLNLAVGEALEHKPENVFQIASKRFRLNMICGGPDVDDARYDSYELSIKAIDKRILKVSSIKDKGMINQCNECIKYLLNAKKVVAKFYQIEN